MASTQNLAKNIYQAASQAQKLALKKLKPLEKKLKATSKTRIQAQKKQNSENKNLEKAKAKLKAKITPTHKKAVIKSEKALKKLQVGLEKALLQEEKLQKQFNTVQAGVQQTLELVALIQDFKKSQKKAKISKKSKAA